MSFYLLPIQKLKSFKHCHCFWNQKVQNKTRKERSNWINKFFLKCFNIKCRGYNMFIVYIQNKTNKYLVFNSLEKNSLFCLMFEDLHSACLHYKSWNVTVLLHPKPGTALPDGIIKSIIDCAEVKNVILFASFPEIEAFQALSLFLKPTGSKQDQKRRFNLNKQILFEMFPHKMSRSPYVFYLHSK